MPRIAESLQQSGYGQQFGAGLGSLFKRLKDDQNQDEFNSLMQEAMNSLRKTYSTQPEENTTWNSESPLPPPQSELGKRLIPPQSDKMDMSDDPGNMTGVNVKPKAPGINIENPDYEILGNVSGRKYGTSTADEQRMQQDQIYADFFSKASNLKNIDPQKLQTGLQTLQLQGKAFTPSKEKVDIRSYKPDEDIYKINDFGDIELVRPGVQDKKESYKSLGSYTGEDGFQYTRIIGSDGIIKEVKSDHKVKPPKGTVINFKPPKSEKWKDFGAYVNSIDYKQNPDTGAIEMNTPEERKIKREMAKNQGIGNMLPRAINWYNTEIKQKWEAENISMADFEKEIEESLIAGELSDEEAQDLLDFNQYRPFLFDMLRDTARDVEGAEE